MLDRMFSLPFPSPFAPHNREVSAADGDLPATPDPRRAMRWAIAGLAMVAIPVVLLTTGPHLGPGIRYADVVALCVCLAAFAVAALLVPWQRLEHNWLPLMVGVPVVFVAALNSLAGAGQSPYFVMYAPLLAIAGWYLSGRQTGLVVALVIATELWRAVALDRSGSVDHLTIAMPFVMAIASTASLTSRWLRSAVVETRRDQIRMASTLDAVRQLGADAQIGVLAQLERAAGRIFDARATAILIGAQRPSDFELKAALTDDRTATILVAGGQHLHALLRLEARSRLSTQDVRLAAILAEAAGRTLDVQSTLQSSPFGQQRDSLTGLRNRRALEHDLDTALAQGSGRSTPDIALVFIDIDDFRVLNDRYGHTAGDDVLIELAGILETAIRPDDSAYRFAGDEFAVLVRGGGPMVAVDLAQRIREHAASDVRRKDDPGLPQFTVSVGFAAPSRTGSAAELIAAADEQMHPAK